KLRWPEDTAKLAVTRSKIGDAHRAALPIGEHSRDDGGIAQIFRLEIREVVEDDIAKSLLLIVGKAPREDRIAVEARIAPPHQARFRIDERSRAPVADHRKIEPVVLHEVANASLREISSSQRRTSAGRSKHVFTPATLRPTEMEMPSNSGRISNT